MGRYYIGLLIGFALLSSGCSIKGEIEGIQVDEVKALQKNGANELNSGAQVRAISSGTYVVSHSLGSVNADLVSKTPEQGYQVFMTVQGSVFSEAVEQP